jgi:pimeloyl-ACP methyl ester carboxylesterase
MPILQSDGVSLYYEVTGSGVPIVFVHEFSGDHRSWEPQVSHFRGRYRCITYAARGYPPSDVPDDPTLYSQELAVADLAAVVDQLELAPAHLVGLSMGGFTALHYALAHPAQVRSLAIAGVGYGCSPDADESWKTEVEHLADFYAEDPVAAAASHSAAPGRIPFAVKDPRGYAQFAEALAAHPATGSSLTMRGVQGRRPNLYDMGSELAAFDRPLLVITGDEDEPCLEPSLYLKRTIATAGLAVLPRTGHTVNLEEPDRFNDLLGQLASTADLGRWTPRDARSLATRQLGHR